MAGQPYLLGHTLSEQNFGFTGLGGKEGESRSRLKCQTLTPLSEINRFSWVNCLHLLHAFRTVSTHFNIFCFVLTFTSYDCFTLERFVELFMSLFWKYFLHPYSHNLKSESLSFFSQMKSCKETDKRGDALVEYKVN